MADLPFLDFRRTVGARIGQTNRKWRMAIDECLKPLELTDATWLPLLHISRLSSPPRQKDLAEFVGIGDSSLVRLIDILVRRGLVRRETDIDRRAKVIVLTAQGRAMVEKVELIIAEVRRKVLTEVSDTDLAVAMKVMDRICAALDNIMRPVKED